MKLVIISSAPFIEKQKTYYSYSPYVKELNIWGKFADEVAISCPFWEDERNLLVAPVAFPVTRFFTLKDFDIKSVTSTLKAVSAALYNLCIIYKAMSWADHIHLRCPGNIGLLGCFVQVLFPQKKKSAKYAGNWDPNAKQPVSYRMQKWILNNTFLTRNMQVLVYGEWEASSHNIKPFFTASYWEADKTDVMPRNISGTIRFVFAGTLSTGKRPQYAIRLIERLRNSGVDAVLDIFGDGVEKFALQQYILDLQLDLVVKLHGNQNESTLCQAYQMSHFMILPSKSEGWPKVVAEAMFWGCVPVSTDVSCVSYMLDKGNRGILLQLDIENDAKAIKELLSNPKDYLKMSASAIDWSRRFTMDFFEREIENLLKL